MGVAAAAGAATPNFAANGLRAALAVAAASAATAWRQRRARCRARPRGVGLGAPPALNQHRGQECAEDAQRGRSPQRPLPLLAAPSGAGRRPIEALEPGAPTSCSAVGAAVSLEA
eukprot:CAMPEP_0177260058 /NCGR_PEP_ID=MMETSP0367-20130122/59022_1 /TAXON_ID=447022 ORGANISM="Scrippsiella hangoei-like, Strain SHHI-4" /NCGR_SAMPLE_ID=MMETSP0367 /ASSEMBLY_ACC=CAM_ASM_000362 /LENGTH=114 /DNA_ID=CAMNT_0018714483 /DNA_START=54 /DNA_END=398 /DNA_ORIENTATION=-